MTIRACICRTHRVSARPLAIVILVLVAMAARRTARAQTLSVLYSFSGHGNGANPMPPLIADSAGTLYGTTPGFNEPPDCSGGCGNVYKLDNAGNETQLYSFKGDADGNNPSGGLVLDSDGNLYGTAAGGTGRYGVVFEVDPAGQETVLYSFGAVDGGGPAGGLLRDGAGNFYGAGGGGTSGNGVIFKLDPQGNKTVLYNFTGRADGGNPNGGLVADESGNLYGTTSEGGDLSACPSLGCGVLFKVDLEGHQTVLYTFTRKADGAFPYGYLARDAANNLYGAATEGGKFYGAYCGGDGCGVVFKVDSAGNETVLYTFSGGADGDFPSGSVIRDPGGNLYGTTGMGGTLNGQVCSITGGCGVVFVLTPSGKEKVLYDFKGTSDGYGPVGPLLAYGNALYSTSSGGNGSYGVVFKLAIP